ncbi:MAG: Xylulose kinase [Firmicutes bacterium]|uniref:Xylulokinase n=2 Tax=Candidatus Hakubella thermalkaliphila TaxID=2754717 RepID=A0A6V8P7G3_9ACTN|nr:FGGY family carbohydrate kinase [Candidatus Hakubella thermalkaliphila]MBT9176055.1 Xylulose kinase [Bacillota bacterium]GFP26716.1 xylulokinase [Candidatus Hakubella thermalkaliphila]GFP34873.1 xylulokinase [Candidatus Hakubella thermalkaliphila]
MSTQLIIGIDIGTRGLKVVVADTQLRILAEAAAGYGVSFPRPGWAEQDPLLWEKALGEAIPEALKSVGAGPGDIEAVGIAGQLDGCIATSKDGFPLAPCLIWMDRRADMPQEIAPASEFRRITGINPDPGHMAAKIRWLIDNEPDCRDASVFHQPVSYMVSRLTGENVLDYGLASTTMLYSLKERGYDPGLLESFGIDRALLPAIAEASSLAGRLNATGAALTGLPKGLPVAVGTGDDFSSPLGAGLASPGRVACVIGTAEVVGALDTSLKIDETGLLETHEYPGGLYYIENPGWLSGGALVWFIKTFGIKNFKEMDRLAAQAPVGANELTFIPALSGAMAPKWVPTARGCFYGLTAMHGVEHMARAVLEGCAYAMRDVIERWREMSVPVDSILLMGGGARSDVWSQIRADISGLPVEQSDRVDTSPVGAAMLAAVASGLQPDVSVCADLVKQTTLTLEPNNANRSAYDDSYAAYRRLFDSLQPMF